MKKENKKIEVEKKNRQYNIIEIIGMTITLILLIFATIYVNYNNREKKVDSEDKNVLLSPTVIYLDNVIGKTAEKDRKIYVGGIFTYLGDEKFYYKPEMFYSNGKKIYNGSCNEVDISKVVNFSFNPTKEPLYARITIYKDNRCSNSIKKYDSKKYSLTASNNDGNSNNNGNNNNNNDNTKAK